MGARAYRHLSLYDPDPGCLIEIGSERGEGSTAWLSRYARDRRLRFVTCDIEPGAHEAATRSIVTGSAHLERGVDVLRRLRGRVSVAYLDGFDWTPEEAQMEPWITDQRALYHRLGYEMTNERCQAEHLAEAELVAAKATPRCAVICDDTWLQDDGQWTGKGGRAVPYLLTEGFEVVDHEGRAEHSLGYTILKR